MSRLLPRHTHNPQKDQLKIDRIIGITPKPEVNWWDGPEETIPLEPKPKQPQTIVIEKEHKHQRNYP